ncbi:MAG: DUF4241 domain-containing protein, partial [Ignavibacteria bacterium]|nr:DUF4241 domain-containing protein [Ignavibacteria bacterium]
SLFFMSIERESMEFDVLIVGGGPAGLTAAIKLKQLAAAKGQDAETFPIGKFPIYYFSIYESGIFIPFVNEEPVNWKVALFNSQKKTKLKSFDLETGNFCITDSDGHAAILKNESNNLYSVNFWEDEIISRYIQEDCEWYYNILIANSKNNLITINTEQIDEIFKSYIGYDLTGNIVCLYTDLGSVMF